MAASFNFSQPLTDLQKLQLAERANQIYRQQLKYMQDHLKTLRSLVQDKQNIIENLMLRYDIGFLAQDLNRQAGNLSTDEIEMEELSRKAEALAERTILENFELGEMVNELRFCSSNRKKCKSEEKNQHLQLWLKNRHLLKQFNMKDTQFMKLCRTKMFQLFGFDNIIQSLINDADTNKLQILFKALKALKIHYDEQNMANTQNKTDQNEPEDDDDCDLVQDDFRMNTGTYNYLDIIPNELLSYIYGYLDRFSIQSIKTVSNRMALVALSEMLKYSVGVFNSNELLKCNHVNDKKYIECSIKYYRYNSTNNYHHIFEEWALRYKIPLKCQLLFKLTGDRKLPIKYINTQNVQLANRRLAQIQSKFMLFDKRTIVRLKANCKPRILHSQNESGDIEDYKLVFLKYFNLEEQLTKTVSILLIHSNIKEYDLSHYVENQFINVGEREWYDKLSSYLKEMSKWNDKKLMFLNATNDWVDFHDKRTGIEHGTILIFQLNPIHPWFLTTKAFDKTDANWSNDIKLLIKSKEMKTKIKKQACLITKPKLRYKFNFL